MSLQRYFILIPIRKKLVGLLLAIAMAFSLGVVPNKALAATDAEILATIQNIVRVIEAIRNQINYQTVGAPVNLPSVTDYFTDSVTIGNTNDSILLLQKILATDSSVYPSGLTTGTFGDLTAEGLRKFQEKFYLPITGTFTAETEYVLNSVLSSVTLETYPANYLTVNSVIEKISTAADIYLLGNVIINGKVALRPFPVFSNSTKSSDTATLQRIMKTDSLIYRGEVTGLMDNETTQGIVKLKSRYGLLSTSINSSDLMNAITITLINKILDVNNSNNIRTNLLTDPGVATGLLISNSEKGIQSIRATKNYRTMKVDVSLLYEGGSRESFIVETFTPDTAVIDAIANKLSRTSSEIGGKIVISTLYAKQPKKIDLTFKMHKKEEVDINIQYLDGTAELFVTDKDDERVLIDAYFGGNEESFALKRDEYFQRARVGDVDPGLYDIISFYVSIDLYAVRDIVTVIVDDSQYQTFDTGGGD